MNSATGDTRKRILDLIESRGLGSGDWLPSERQMAREWRISHSAVNRAVLQLIAADVLQRDGYRLHLATAGKAGQSRRPVHFVCESAHVTRAVERVAAAHGHSLVAIRTRFGETLRKELLELLEQSGTAGLLVWQRREVDLLERFREAGVPVVICGQRWPGRSYVAPDPHANVAVPVHHLHELGHREIAFLGRRASASQQPLSRGGITGYEEACRDLGMDESANRVQTLPYWDAASIRGAWREIHQSASVSAVVCQGALLASRLAAILREEGLRVPGDVSLVCCRDDELAASHDPPLTSAHTDDPALASMAALLLFTEIAALQETGRQPEAHAVHFHPHLRRRQSSGPPPNNPQRVAEEANAASAVLEWPAALSERQAMARRINGRRFSRLPDLPRNRELLPLDIGSLANRGTRRRNSWLGHDPLLHFPPGIRSIHGIPFRILDEKENAGRAAIVLRSAKARSSGGRPLPESVELSVGKRVEAVYILHACGFANHDDAFAEYELAYSTGDPETVPIIAFGHAKNSKRRRAEALVQDWHPSYPQFYSRQTLPFAVTAADPLAYSRFLYSYEWINPHPERELQAIRIRSRGPERVPTLAVLAITLRLVQQ